jgi:hypothetical protein
MVLAHLQLQEMAARPCPLVSRLFSDTQSELGWRWSTYSHGEWTLGPIHMGPDYFQIVEMNWDGPGPPTATENGRWDVVY